LKNVVDSLVKSGEIASEDNGRFIAYSLKKTVAVSDKESKVSSFSTTPVREDIIDDVRIDKPTLPGATESMMSGYSISSDKDKNKVIITLPDGKKVKINNNDSLLIINGEPKYKVSTPLDVLSCIKEYALANGMAHFVADDIAQNKKIKTDGDIQINDNHLMFLSVKKHNKAA